MDELLVDSEMLTFDERGAIADRRPWEIELERWAEMRLAPRFDFDYDNLIYGDNSVTPNAVLDSADVTPSWLAPNRREVLAAEVSADWGKSAAGLPPADPGGDHQGQPAWQAGQNRVALSRARGRTPRACEPPPRCP